MAKNMFREQQRLNSKLLKLELSRLYKEKLVFIETKFEPSGYTGSVYFVNATFESGVTHMLVIKGFADVKEHDLYTDFLKPYKLNSPIYLGKINLDNHNFLVMDRIDSVTNLLNHKAWLDEALSWLIYKDTVCSKRIDDIKKIDSINKQINNGERWWSIIENCAASNLHPLIDLSMYKRLLKKRTRLEEYGEVLQSGIQTVTHNDFQKRNTLIDQDGKLFVIDWSTPNIGSPCIDLARLIEANAGEAEWIKKAYSDNLQIDGFDDLLSMARFRNTFSIFTWMCKAITDGQKEAVEAEYDIRQYIKKLTA